MWYDKFMFMTYHPDLFILIRKIESVRCFGFGCACMHLRKVLGVAHLVAALANPATFISNELDTFINSGTCTIHKEYCKGSIILSSVLINVFLDEVIVCYTP